MFTGQQLGQELAVLVDRQHAAGLACPSAVPGLELVPALRCGNLQARAGATQLLGRGSRYAGRGTEPERRRRE